MEQASLRRRFASLISSKQSRKKRKLENNNYLFRPESYVPEENVSNWIVCFGIVISLSILCYVNVCYGEFLHDDVRAIRGNPDVRGETPLVDIFRNDFWGRSMSDSKSHKSYRPLAVLTLR